MGRSDIGVSLNVSATHMERTSCLAPPYGSLLMVAGVIGGQRRWYRWRGNTLTEKEAR